MKTTLLGLTALAVAVLTFHHSPSRSIDVPSGPQAVNAIVGDASFYEAFGRAPDLSTDEDLRLRTHLVFVHRRLAQVPAAEVPAALRAARARNLARLADYIALGSFPRNPPSIHRRTPNFLDAQGRICAVGYLVREDLGPVAIEAINREHQFARIQDMESAALAAWQQTSGLTMLELASIQPEYCPGGPGCVGDGNYTVMPSVSESSIRTEELALGMGNLALTAFNLVRIGQGKPSTALGLGTVGVGLLGGTIALRNDTSSSKFAAATGFVAALSGLVQLSRTRTRMPTGAGEGAMGVASPSPRVELGPVIRDGGTQALAVHVRF